MKNLADKQRDLVLDLLDAAELKGGDTFVSRRFGGRLERSSFLLRVHGYVRDAYGMQKEFGEWKPVEKADGPSDEAVAAAVAHVLGNQNEA